MEVLVPYLFSHVEDAETKRTRVQIVVLYPCAKIISPLVEDSSTRIAKPRKVPAQLEKQKVKIEDPPRRKNMVFIGGSV